MPSIVHCKSLINVTDNAGIRLLLEVFQGVIKGMGLLPRHKLHIKHVHSTHFPECFDELMASEIISVYF